jgi:VIT1/CCC1 family predicted Fe2+/Mn2+ transporter
MTAPDAKKQKLEIAAPNPVPMVSCRLALLGTGAVVGLLSGGPPLRRALRQLGIGYGAAAVTYLLGLLFGTTTG